MPRVAIIGTGGTIQNTDGGRVSLASLLEAVIEAPGAGLDPAIAFDSTELLSAGAETFGPPEWLAIARAVDHAVRRHDIAGVVLTHGTFTAEETAYLLHLVIDTHKPIVIAVSQRKHGSVGNDGDRNLLDAIRVAATAEAASKGVLLVVSEEVHSARDVTKEHQRLTGFRSDGGPIGTVESDRVTIYREPLRRHTHRSALRLAALEAMPRVDIVAAYPGADATAVDAFVAAGAEGLVTAGYAYSGIGTPLQMIALEAAARHGVTVVLASRGRGGRVPESGREWSIRADNLTPQKARILLGLALAVTRSRDEVQELFDTH